jgi:hypothetical protein
MRGTLEDLMNSLHAYIQQHTYNSIHTTPYIQQHIYNDVPADEVADEVYQESAPRVHHKYKGGPPKPGGTPTAAGANGKGGAGPAAAVAALPLVQDSDNSGVCVCVCVNMCVFVCRSSFKQRPA